MTTQTRPRASSGRPASYWFDEDAADRAVEFYGLFLRHVKGELAGSPLILQDWAAEEIIRPTFGWKREDGTRKYRRVYVEVPRKNAKSTIAAGIGLYLLYADGEPGAEVYSAAADRAQAKIVFDVARSMVQQEPELLRRSRVFEKAITVPLTNSSYKALSADVPTKHGLNASGIVFDELHAQANRDLWDVLTTSVGSRRQPLVFAITTAGFDKHTICWELHDYAIKVLGGIIEDPFFLPVIYAASEGLDWWSDEALEMANPGLDVTVHRDYLEAERQRALEVPGYQNTFRRLHLNQWTEQAQRWLDMQTWSEAAAARTPAELSGRECFAGLDLSTTTDISALVLAFPGEDGGVDLLPFFWIPEEGMRRRAQRDGVPYDLWVNEGLVKATPGSAVDFDVIRQDINRLGELYDIREVLADPWNAAQLLTQLQGDGFQVAKHMQGYSAMTAPAKAFEALVLERRLRHGGNPVLRWMASNVAVAQDAAGNIKPNKEKSSDRIDGVVAAIMAVGRIGTAPEGLALPGVLPLWAPRTT